jgi:hypothetical protein
MGLSMVWVSCSASGRHAQVNSVGLGNFTETHRLKSVLPVSGVKTAFRSLLDWSKFRDCG